MNVAQFGCVLTAAQQAIEEREAERRVLLEEDEQQYHTPNESAYSHCHLHRLCKRYCCHPLSLLTDTLHDKFSHAMSCYKQMF